MTMRIQIEAGNVGEAKADTLVIPITRRGETPKSLPSGLSSLDRRMGGRLSDALAPGDYRAGVGDRLVVYGPQGGDPVRCIFLGLGEEEKIDEEAVRTLGGRVGREVARAGVGRVSLIVPSGPGLRPDDSVAVLTEGAILGAYKFDRYQGTADTKKKKKAPARPRLSIHYLRSVKGLAALRAASKRSAQIAESQVIARDLSNEPPNVIYPESLAREARAMARKVGLKCRVMNVAEMERRGMGAILAVGQGSIRPPRMIVLEHGATPKTQEGGDPRFDRQGRHLRFGGPVAQDRRRHA